MSIRSIAITVVAAAGFCAFAPATASAAPLAPAVFEVTAPNATPDLYTDVRYHSRRGFHRGYYAHRGFHGRSRFHRGYYGRHGFHHRSSRFHGRHHGFHDRYFDRRGFHKSKQFRNRHGVVIKKRH